jgi:hypothetical protein
MLNTPNENAAALAGANAAQNAHRAYRSPHREQVRRAIRSIPTHYLKGEIDAAVRAGNWARARALIREEERRVNWARNWRRAWGGRYA